MASTFSKLTADLKNFQSRAAAWGIEKSGRASSTPIPEHIQAACKRLHNTIAELTDLYSHIQAAEKLNKERTKLQFSLIQSMGKLGSHSKSSEAATHVVGTFVTTNMSGVSRNEALAKAHTELLVVPLTTLLEMDVQQALTAEKLYKGALAAYDVAAFDMRDSLGRQAAADEKEANKPHDAVLQQSKHALAESAKSKAVFEKKLEDLCALVEAKKNHFLEENVFRYMLQERNYHRETYEALIEAIDHSGLKERSEAKEGAAPVERSEATEGTAPVERSEATEGAAPVDPAAPASEERPEGEREHPEGKERPEDEEEEDDNVAKDSPQLHTVDLAEPASIPKEPEFSEVSAVEVHLS